MKLKDNKLAGVWIKSSGSRKPRMLRKSLSKSGYRNWTKKLSRLTKLDRLAAVVKIEMQWTRAVAELNGGFGASVGISERTRERTWEREYGYANWAVRRTVWIEGCGADCVLTDPVSDRAGWIRWMGSRKTARKECMDGFSDNKALRQEKSGMDHVRSREVNWGRTGGKEAGSGPYKWYQSDDGSKTDFEG
ncbi:hypothetical protein F2Q70_00016651 [Brassica cretica]|uniref:Uncharacterized protein n=1 Tax=Brassica cretica TaxID=69181 RepID=A0A8S9HYJ4_BRACR|nr:hypothetical protein F2Q70_00016651 [Brassica cretica]